MRVGTLNVYSSNSDNLIHELKQQRLDLIGLQETTQKFVIRCARKLNMYYKMALAHDNFGNAILSRYPIVKSRNIELKVPGVERRAAVYVEISTNKGTLKVMCTHLDHKHELARLNQLSLLSYRSVDILMGDFNSLNVADYTESHLSRIIEERYADGWETVHGDVMNLLSIDFNITPYSGSTSRFDTRIDYILVNHNAKVRGRENIRIRKVSEHVIDMSSYTDHNMVVAIIKEQT